MAKLYDIVAEIENFRFEIDEETGEILNAKELDDLEMERDKKIENLCLWIKNLRADVKAYEDEEKSFALKKKQAKNKLESLENYVQYILAGEKFKTDKVSVSYRKSESVDCIDINYVDDDYLIYSEPRLNKRKIRDALKSGTHVVGCTLAEKVNMQIR